MKRVLFFFSLLVFVLEVEAQGVERTGFSSPFSFTNLLSANFGELRGDHFHGGIDFKTQGVSGKAVLALADGYISRARVTKGSGLVLHVTYDNGFSTISRHLSGFLSPIKEKVIEQQYLEESWEVDLQFDSHEIPVRRGEQIAWSGNTGYSFGPHLHLDVIEDATGDYIDPMPFFAASLKDTRKPEVKGIMCSPKLGEGVVNGKQEIQLFSAKEPFSIKAWGKIGLGIKAFDYMDGTHNHYGVHTVELYVDNELTFRSVVDRFSPTESGIIRGWVHQNYMRSFITPGNTLRMIESFNDEEGFLVIEEERPYAIRYELTDFHGNKELYRFTIHGANQIIAPAHALEGEFMAQNRSNQLQRLGLNLYVPQGALYEDALLSFTTSMHADESNIKYSFSKSPIYLKRPATLQIRVRNPIDTIPLERYYLAGVNRKGKTYYLGGKFDGEFLEAQVKELGTVIVLADTLSPEVLPIQKDKWSINRKLSLQVKEKESGISNYYATIDGDFVPFAWNIMNNTFHYTIDTGRIDSGKNHTLLFKVVDRCGNVTVYNDEFFW